MAQIKILIKTPAGYAKSTEFKLRPFLIGNKGKIHKILTNKNDDQILWLVDAKAGQYMKIIKNVSTYRSMVASILKNKTVRKVARLTEDQKKELDHMLDDQTQISIVKENEWGKIKKEFKEI